MKEMQQSAFNTSDEKIRLFKANTVWIEVKPLVRKCTQ